MISKTTNGNGFGGSLQYLLGKDHAEIISQNLVHGEDANSIALQMRFIAGSRTNTPVHHISLSFHEKDKIDNDQMIKIADSFMEKSGYNKDMHQWTVIRHHDTSHEHMHILANRVGMDHTIVSNFKNKSKGVRLAQAIEKEFDLVRVDNIKKSKPLKVTKNRKLTSKKKIIERVESCLELAEDITTFSGMMMEGGIDVRLNKSSTGKVSGISFAELENTRNEVAPTVFSFKGSQLGKQYSFSKIQDHLDCNRVKNDLEREEQQRIQQQQHKIELEKQEQQRIQQQKAIDLQKKKDAETLEIARKKAIVAKAEAEKKKESLVNQEQNKPLAKSVVKKIVKKPTKPKDKEIEEDLER